MKVKIKPYGRNKAYKWQSEAHHLLRKWRELDTSDYLKDKNVFIIKASRQKFGKTAFAKAELINFSFGKDKEHKNSAYLAPTLKLARKMYKSIANGSKSITREKNGIDLIITFNNGSTIQFFSAEQRDGLRGFTVTGVLVIDEATFIQDDIYYELVSPWTLVAGAPTIIMSTPKFRKGFFYDLYKLGLDEESALYTTLDWTAKYPVDIKGKLLEIKKTIPKNRFLSEYVGEFIDMEGNVFANFEDLILYGSIAEYKNLYWGIDFGTGTGSDWTVLTAYNERGEQVFMFRWNSLSPTKQVDQITKILTTHKEKTKRIIAEENSIGKVYIDMIRKTIKSITYFNTSNDSKREIIEDYQTAIEQKLCRLYNDPSYHNELAMYEPQKTPTGKLTYNAPKGMNDDTVIASALAWRGYKYRNNSGFRVS